jgi:hypothetical protein
MNAEIAAAVGAAQTNAIGARGIDAYRAIDRVDSFAERPALGVGRCGGFGDDSFAVDDWPAKSYECPQCCHVSSQEVKLQALQQKLEEQRIASSLRTSPSMGAAYPI